MVRSGVVIPTVLQVILRRRSPYAPSTFIILMELHQMNNTQLDDDKKKTPIAVQTYDIMNECEDSD
jgi:hypothetical protein